MKMAATRIALMTATIMMTIMLPTFWPMIKLTTNDSAVQMHKAPKILRYNWKFGPSWASCAGSAMGQTPRTTDCTDFTDKRASRFDFYPCSSVSSVVRNSHQVQQREQENPHDIDKVPVQARVFDEVQVLRPEA